MSGGISSQYEQRQPPVAVLRIEICPTFPVARRREARLKRWSRAKKLALICDDHDRLKQLSRSRG
jgi:predicted GIY-YIG superfamily endonuclease